MRNPKRVSHRAGRRNKSADSDCSSWRHRQSINNPGVNPGLFIYKTEGLVAIFEAAVGAGAIATNTTARVASDAAE